MQTDELRKGFLEAIQQWLRKTPDGDRAVKDVTTSLPSNRQLQQQSDKIIVKGPAVQSKQNDKTTITAALPSRFDSSVITLYKGYSVISITAHTYQTYSQQ